MRIYNPTYKKVRINWDSVELPVNQGSPISADGVVANTSDAIGLLPVYIYKKPIDEEVYILIGGDVYQSEVEAEFGAELTDDAIASMGGINFYEADGTIDKASGGGGGDNGSLECHVDPETFALDKTWKEVDDALKAGKTVFAIDSFESDAVFFTSRYECLWTIGDEEHNSYQAYFSTISYLEGGPEVSGLLYSAQHATDYLLPD